VRHNLTLNLGVRWDKDINLIGTSAQALNGTYHPALKAINHPAARLCRMTIITTSVHGWALPGTCGGSSMLFEEGYGLYGQTFLKHPAVHDSAGQPDYLCEACLVSVLTIGCLVQTLRSPIGDLESIHSQPSRHPRRSFCPVTRAE